MVSRKIENVRACLGDLAGKVTGENWGVISSCRRLLEDAQVLAEELEKRLEVPGTTTDTTAQAARGQ